MRVLILTQYYLPGVKGGGPIQSINNLIDNLSDKLDFRVITSDRDFGDVSSYPDIEPGVWVRHNNAQIFYVNREINIYRQIRKLLQSNDYDVIYLNSLFSFKYSIYPLLLSYLKLTQKKSIILAPRGELSHGAMKFKYQKKRTFLFISKLLGLYKNIFWHATSESEKKNIEDLFKKTHEISIIGNMVKNNVPKLKESVKKEKDKLKVVFISRIHPKKNLLFALRIFNNITGEIQFDIYGPIEDSAYWNECKRVINELPQNITVEYKGIIKHDNVIKIFSLYHIFLFPTLGENFGHVIIEALLGGCPVIISEKTPWRDIPLNNAGKIIALNDEKGFIKAIHYYLSLDNNEYIECSNDAHKFGVMQSENKQDIKKYFNLFTSKIT